jgi:aldose 1-epimerase
VNCQLIDSITPGFSYYHFSEEEFSCKIVPAFGGSLQELIVDGKPIIEGATIDESGYEKYLQYCFSALLFPFPNRIKDGTFTFEDKTYSLAINEPSNHNAIHGLVFDKTFETVSAENHSLTLRYRHQGSPGFPFPFEFRIAYTIANNRIEMEFHIENTGTSAFPFGLGWHPYFVTETQDNSQINFLSDKKYEVNEDMIPFKAEKVEESTFDLTNNIVDNAFRLTAQDIEFNTRDYKLTMKVPADSYLQLYTPLERNAVAIEPMSCISNAFNNEVGLRSIKKNDEFRWEITIAIGDT